jgi:hypothetical protein
MRIWRKLLGLSRSIKLDTESWSDVREGYVYAAMWIIIPRHKGEDVGFMGFPCMIALAFLGALCGWISARTYFGDTVRWHFLGFDGFVVGLWRYFCFWNENSFVFEGQLSQGGVHFRIQALGRAILHFWGLNWGIDSADNTSASEQNTIIMK